MVQGLTFVPVLKHLLLHSKRKTQRKSCFTTKLFLKYETELWGQIVCIYFRALKIVFRVTDNSPEKIFALTEFTEKGSFIQASSQKEFKYMLKITSIQDNTKTHK